MIDVKNLEYAYPGAGEKTIRGIDFNINSGEIFGFLGPSGAGKSTSQKILIGLLKDYRGYVFVMGREIRHWNRDYYERVGVGFEYPNLYQKLTAMENLRLAASFYSVKTEEPMKLLGIVGLEDKAGVRVAQFSKGMKMRLNFIRSFIHNPELIFLDEPTSGLDPVNAKRIKELILLKKKEGKTIFLTTHNMSVAEDLCDRVAFIVDGEIKLIDSPKELKIRYGTRSVRVEYYQGGGTSQMEFPLAELGRNREFIRLLSESDIKTIHTMEATLEDIFINVTGRRLD